MLLFDSDEWKRSEPLIQNHLIDKKYKRAPVAELDRLRAKANLRVDQIEFLGY